MNILPFSSRDCSCQVQYITAGSDPNEGVIAEEHRYLRHIVKSWHSIIPTLKLSPWHLVLVWLVTVTFSLCNSSEQNCYLESASQKQARVTPIAYTSRRCDIEVMSPQNLWSVAKVYLIVRDRKHPPAGPLDSVAIVHQSQRRFSADQWLEFTE